MPSAKPKLEKLATPVTSNFPSAINSANTATPSSALPIPKHPDVDFVRTPISPPPAYADFLSKAMSLNSPAVSSLETSPESAPTSAVSDKSENSSKTSLSSSKDDSSPPTSRGRSKASPIATAISPSTYTQLPMSAPPTGAATFPSLKLPPSPAISNYDSPISAASSLRSPFSARSVRSVFDWDAALKARYADQKRAKTSRTSVRHIREVVTRTVTYTPKMEPAPRGKRRRVE